METAAPTSWTVEVIAGSLTVDRVKPANEPILMISFNCTDCGIKHQRVFPSMNDMDALVPIRLGCRPGPIALGISDLDRAKARATFDHFQRLRREWRREQGARSPYPAAIPTKAGPTPAPNSTY